MNVRTFSLRILNAKHPRLNVGNYAMDAAHAIVRSKAFEILNLKGDPIRLDGFWGDVGHAYFSYNSLPETHIELDSFVLGLLMAGCTIYTQE